MLDVDLYGQLTEIRIFTMRKKNVTIFDLLMTIPKYRRQHDFVIQKQSCRAKNRAKCMCSVSTMLVHAQHIIRTVTYLLAVRPMDCLHMSTPAITRVPVARVRLGALSSHCSDCFACVCTLPILVHVLARDSSPATLHLQWTDTDSSCSEVAQAGLLRPDSARWAQLHAALAAYTCNLLDSMLSTRPTCTLSSLARSGTWAERGTCGVGEYSCHRCMI
jgi:hypothetical protein